jgi:hypothetical protein
VLFALPAARTGAACQRANPGACMHAYPIGLALVPIFFFWNEGKDKKRKGKINQSCQPWSGLVEWNLSGREEERILHTRRIQNGIIIIKKKQNTLSLSSS